MVWNRKWDRTSVVKAIQSRHQEGLSLNPQAVRRDDMGLYQAAFRYVGSWQEALQEAEVTGAYLRRQWDPRRIRLAVRKRASRQLPLNPAAVQDDDPGLWGAANRYFGSWRQTLEAAGIAASDAFIRAPKK